MGNPSAPSSSGYQEDINREIIDIADGNATYLVKENTSSSGQLAYLRVDGSLSTTYISSTDVLKSSIGIFAIKNTISPSGKTTLKSNLESALKIKVSSPEIYNPNTPKFRMYLKGKNAPIARIDYQASYEGSMFRVKFANESENYIAYFNNENTHVNPATLKKPFFING